MQRRLSIVGIGEVLWDVFPDGPRFGGAPANFAGMAAQLAAGEADVAMVSSVGRDELGAAAIVAMKSNGVVTKFIAEHDQQSGRVDVIVDAAGVASYVFAEDVAWDHLEWKPELEKLAVNVTAVCFGSLAQRTELSSATIQRFVHLTPSDALRVFDINLRTPYWSEKVIRESLELANVLKLNDSELSILRSMFDLKGDLEQQLRQLGQRFSLRLVALTRGAEGSLLCMDSGETSDLPAQPTQIVDTVGAGDGFTAAMVVGMLKGMPLEEIHAWAGRIAAYVCSQPGGTPALPTALREGSER